MVTIAHISDPHVGSPYFVPNLMNRVIVELNELAPDLVVCTGDLTNEGYRQEFKNWVAYRERIKAPIVTVPGNHDARNVGYLHFEELIGPRHWATDVTLGISVGVFSGYFLPLWLHYGVGWNRPAVKTTIQTSVGMARGWYC